MSNLNRKAIFVISLSLILVFSLVSNYTFAAKPDKTPPTAPSNLKSIAVEDTSVTLTWNPSTDNVGVKNI